MDMSNMARHYRNKIIGTWVILAVGTGTEAQAPLPDHEGIGPEGRIVRISLEAMDSQPADVHDWLHERLDTCAVDRDDDGVRRAVFFLNPNELGALQARGVPVEDAGSLADHMVQFAPWNTLARKSIPSFEPYLPGPVETMDGEPRGPGGCEEVGTSLQPYNEYHTIEESLCFLQNLASAYPGFVRLSSIGQTIEGRDIWALKITDNPDSAEPDEEAIFLKGVTHAREWATHETMLYIAEYLTSRYATDPQVQRIVDRSVVWLVPIANPDGFWYTWNGPAQQNARMWRKNRRVNVGSSCLGVDINRNYSYNWAFDNSGSNSNKCAETYRGASAASEPETQAIQNFVAAQKPVISVSYHSYSQLWLFAWGYTTGVTPESFTSMRAIARRLSQLVYGVHGKDYVPGQSSYTIYRTNGDFNDFAYGTHGVMGFTPEVRPATSAQGGFLLPEDQILACAEENMAAALWLMDNVAGAITMTNGGSSKLFEPVAQNQALSFSLPATPVHQKPQDSLGYPMAYTTQLLTRLDDALHSPPSWGAYPNMFEGCGVGSGYELQAGTEAALVDWANGVESYRALPYVFEYGADVMLSNVAPGLNIVGIPSPIPVDLRSITIVKRKLTPPTGDYGATENILGERSAIEDATNLSPWIDWNWQYIHPDGTVETSHPLGPNTEVLPFRAYRVQVNVPSYQFGSSQDAGAVYYLRFPASSLDCNRNDVLDSADIATAGSHDCNSDGVPDECQLDCNENGYADECDPILTDVDFFVSQLLADTPDPAHYCLQDMNLDFVLDGQDIEPFVYRLLGL